jgi:phosphoribosyl 1,2-cyclic phosphodiesterase
VRVTICGSRGSIPTPGAEFLVVGGETPCVAVAHDGEAPCLVLDAGSGIRRVTARLRGRPFRGTLLLSQLHWDHTQGLPFFAGGDRDGARVRLAIPAQGEPPLPVLARTMSPPHFPVTPLDLRGEWSFEDYGEGPFEVEGFEVRAREVPHGGGRTMGLRVSDGRASIAYVPDHAPHALGAGEDGLGPLHEAAVELAEGVDLLLHDAQYTAAELPQRFEFGHAAAEYAHLLAARCGVRRLLLFHHDPDRTDPQVGEIVRSLQGNGVRVDAATDGLVIDL